MRNGKWTFASMEASEFPFGVFPALSRCPVRISQKVEKLSSRPSPPKWSAREAPNSR